MKIQGRSQTLSILVLIPSITETSFEVKSFNTGFNGKKFTKPKDEQVKIGTNHFSFLILTLSRDTGCNLKSWEVLRFLGNLKVLGILKVLGSVEVLESLEVLVSVPIH